MMYDKSWIKAAFVREPRERILSAYLNKVVDENALIEFCNEYSKTFAGFLKSNKNVSQYTLEFTSSRTCSFL